MSKPKDISKIKDPQLLGSITAMQRAAELARETAFQTNTGIVISRGGEIIHISADELRAEAKAKATEHHNH